MKHLWFLVFKLGNRLELEFFARLMVSLPKDRFSNIFVIAKDKDALITDILVNSGHSTFFVGYQAVAKL